MSIDGASGPIEPGDLLAGRYRIQELIGEGGMADVYRAEDTALGRTVAIKVIRGQTDTPGHLERVRSETTILASMSHPSLVTLFDAHLGEQGQGYLVMEYIDGPTLRDLIARGPVDAAEVAAMTAELAEALHAVHDAGIVHRDIKPSNVILAPSPLPGRQFRPKLADFGIAYLLDSTRLTTPGMLIGTAAYLAPEQVRGQQPAPPADIYALGLVALEAITGQRAYPNAAGHEAIAMRLTVAPTVPDSLDPGWKRLLTAMTATDPALRPTSLEVAVAASALIAPPGATGLTAVLPVADQPTEALPGAAALGAAAGGAALGAGAAGAAAAAADAPTQAAFTPPLPTIPASVAAAAAGSSDPPRKSRLRPGLITAGAAGLALIVALGIAWFASLPGPAADPSPSPSSTPSVVESPSTEPVSDPSPSVATTPPDDKGNDNSGPGNDNGGGNDDKGDDNGKGNGKGKDD